MRMHVNFGIICSSLIILVSNMILFVSDMASRAGLRIDKAYHDVASAFGHSQTFVEVRQSSRMHQHPTSLGVCDGAVVSGDGIRISI